MNPTISILLPGIRYQLWPAFYDSILKSYSGAFELIIVGPYEPTFKRRDIFYYEDWGSPIRCQQIALTKAQGRFVTWMSDDGLYLPGMLDRAMALLIEEADKSPIKEEFHAVTCKYLEGDGDPVELAKMETRDYYRYDYHHGTAGLRLPPGCLMLNVAIASTEMVLGLGGWDCQFESTLAWADLAVRMQRHGVQVHLLDEIAVKHGHMPGRTGDHAPMHDAQIDHDEPLFRKIYSDPAEDRRVTVNLDNWKQSPERWERRFGKA